ncbi:MAG: hypothetical protein ACK6D7_04935, partial [Acidobacteriota bacterium]
MRAAFGLLLPLALLAADYRTPAGTRPAARRPGGETILPGGRMLAPLGRQFQTGPGIWGLAVSPDGRHVVSADGGPNRYSLTVLDQSAGAYRIHTIEALGSRPKPADDDDEFRSVFMGLAFENNHDIWASEGNSGRVR